MLCDQQDVKRGIVAPAVQEQDLRLMFHAEFTPAALLSSHRQAGGRRRPSPFGFLPAQRAGARTLDI
ncbi:hypothetical protein AU512_09805 [Lonsdalea iberica]|uniref:Uncharacterized protein n=1 Tax=Lonsdalea iberica TaxID=1082703 RepID=A0ABX3XFC8_9GAMM|nr:hypothetical protein AU512_09805 [Lonsdalea iberica]